MCHQHEEIGHAGADGLVVRQEHDPNREPFPWDIGVYDAHCHPTDTMGSVPSISGMKARALTVMSTRSQDQDLVGDVAAEQGVQDAGTLFADKNPSRKFIPAFGWHPWFSYQLYDDLSPNPTYDGTEAGKKAHYDAILAPAPSSKDPSFSAGLQDPKPLSEFLNETRKRLEQHPYALVGEIGIDKAFRIPESWTSNHDAGRDDTLTPGGREGRRLSPFRVQMAQQTAVLKAQLKLAGEMGRPVSVHGVQAHGVLHDTIAECWKGHEKDVLSRRQKRRIAQGAEDFSDSEDEVEDKVVPKPYPPRICLHSFSGPANVVKQYSDPAIPAKIYFSFSVLVNWSTGGGEKAEEAIRLIPDDRILVESDLHTAGEDMDQLLEEVTRKICEVKGWGLKEGVERLGQNWKEFVFGRSTF